MSNFEWSKCSTLETVVFLAHFASQNVPKIEANLTQFLRYRGPWASLAVFWGKKRRVRLVRARIGLSLGPGHRS